jgi:putative peptidoglycan lipid II flippase
MFWLDTVPLSSVVSPLPEGPLYLGALGLSLGASVGAWVELWRLRRALRPTLPDASVPWAAMSRMAGVALAALLPALGLWALLPNWDVLLVAPLVTAAYAAVYLGGAALLGFKELTAWTQRFLG